ncbi:BCCT family transporter [Shimia sp. MMG029]|uniref:BCCT family transporter n=1 Tax=Shimia sp. MMG029 TaxID=3021978 RepID=UPI0022FEB73E|nr:BCCT family transporter [Shimia sp. MMG029]MDA5558256.1 BCCT family transporter [Shimia sp. MMG029]
MWHRAQFWSNLTRIGLDDWLLNEAGKPSVAGIVVSLAIIMGASTLSALFGALMAPGWAMHRQADKAAACLLLGLMGRLASFVGVFLTRISRGCRLYKYFVGALQTAMVIGALPFSLVMVLMGIALIKAVVRDALREKNGVKTVY